eukprot:c18604_g1_i2 orf=165-335(-)
MEDQTLSNRKEYAKLNAEQCILIQAFLSLPQEKEVSPFKKKSYAECQNEGMRHNIS